MSAKRSLRTGGTPDSGPGSPSIPTHSIDAFLGALAKLVDLFTETVGSHCEIVLHDLRNPASSVVHVRNGHVTGRAVGQGIRDLMGILHHPDFAGDMLVNYLPAFPVGQRRLRSSTAIFRDESGEPVAALCINLDVTDFVRALELLAELARVERRAPDRPATVTSPDIAQMVEHLIVRTVQSYGKPVDAMDKEDKMAIVRFLDERGAFLTRGAARRVAKELKVTQYSIYKYLKELRGTDREASV